MVLADPQGSQFESVAPSVIRSAGFFGGWYGLWYFEDQETTGYARSMWNRVGQAGIRRMFYFDGGQVGDYAGFFDSAGRMIRNGWSLPFWNGSPRIAAARWFGLRGFVENVAWAPYPTAEDYELPAFTHPDGSTIAPGMFYEVVSRKTYENEVHHEIGTAPNIDDSLAAISMLDQISEKINGQWKTTDVRVIDYANPQMRDYRAYELLKLIEELSPDGVHIDELGDNNLWLPSETSFGEWTEFRFVEYLSSKFTPAQLRDMGIDNIGGFSIRDYARTRRNYMHPAWTEDRIWNEFKIFKTETGRDFWRVVAEAIRGKTKAMGLDFAITGNLIPLWPGAGLNLGIADIVNFEWMGEGSYPGFSEMGLPPKGRAAYVARLGEKLSNAPYCWINLYVTYAHANLPELHKVMAFDCFANRGILDFSYDYAGKTHPGTDASARFINEVIKAVAAHGLSGREYVADIGLVFNPWCDVAESTVRGMQYQKFIEEYSGWCDFLVHTHRQWDVLHSETLSAQALARYPIVVLPSVVVLTDVQVDLLKNYVQSGGRLVATGASGKRFGAEGSLISRPVNAFAGFHASGYRATGDYPGVAYRLNNRSPSAAMQMESLLGFEDFSAVLTTDAPTTTGVNLSRHERDGQAMLSIDVNNTDYDLAVDAVNDAPEVQIVVHLPPELAGRALRVRHLYAGMDDYSSALPLPSDRIVVSSDGARIQLHTIPTRYFQTILIEPVEGPALNSPRLVNLSARGPVGNAGDLLIGGFVITGGSARKVLIRASGETLGLLGVPDALEETVLRLFDAGGAQVAENANWGDAANAAEIRASAEVVGAFAFGEGSTDSAVLVNLAPGAYTVQVSGKEGSPGNAIVEVYLVP